MSRIGKLPVSLPQGVTATVGADNVVKVKGPLGELSQKVDSDIKVTVEGGVVTVSRPTDQPRHRSMHGLYRALIHNMVVGVSTGFTVKQELVGVGYRVDVKGQILEMNLGFSHDIHFQIPAEVKAEAEPVKKGANPVLVLKSADKQLLGVVAAKIVLSVNQSLTKVKVSSLWVRYCVVRLVSLLVLNNKEKSYVN